MLWLIVAPVGFVAVLFAITVVVGAPYVPSHRKDISQLLDALNVGRDDILLDIGSGDGVVLGMAAHRGAKAVGVEINPLLVLLSRYRLRRFGKLISIRWGDSRRMQTLKKVTIIYVFAAAPYMSSIVDLAKRQAAEQRKSLVLVSYGFAITALGQARQIGPYMVYEIAPDNHFTDKKP